MVSQVLYWAAQTLNIDVNAALTVAEKAPALHDHIDAVATALQQQSELALLSAVDAEITQAPELPRSWQLQRSAVCNFLMLQLISADYKWYLMLPASSTISAFFCRFYSS